MSGMTKLITSNNLPDGFSLIATLLEDPAMFVKAAASFRDNNFPAPDKDHVGIHLVALGDVERYGFNRNGDGFPKKACRDYHPTFVKYGHVYKHHKNTDPNKRLGQIVKSAYNEPMGRIELFIHAHKEKAADQLEKMAKDGEASYSMSCRVQFDRCNACGAIRKNAKDPNMCDHVRYQLGKTAEDGTMYGVHNDEPKFFDISFVYRPADRIAWNLSKAASDDIGMDSIKLAEEAGVMLPEEYLELSGHAATKQAIMRKLAAAERSIHQLAGSDHQTRRRSVTWQLCKGASAGPSDQDINALRRYEIADTMYALASAGVVLDPISFCKYAFGPDLGEVAQYLPAIEEASKDLFTNLVKQAEYYGLCSDGTFDVDVYRLDPSPRGLHAVVNSLKPLLSCEEKYAADRAVANVVAGHDPCIVKSASQVQENAARQVANLIMEKYASYKLSALFAVRHFHPDDANECQTLLGAAQHTVHIPKV